MKKFFTFAIAATVSISAIVSVILFDDKTDSSAESIETTQTVKTTVLVPTTDIKIVANSYSVASGDTLIGIADNLLGNEELFTVIFDQNKTVIETIAFEHGFESSGNGHWIFTGTTLSISLPVITTVLVPVEVETEISDFNEVTATSTSTSEPTATLSATETSSPTASATATFVPSQTATNTAVATATETVTPQADSSVTATPTVTETSTHTATVEATATETPSSTPTAIPFTFSPTLPVVPVDGITFYISTYFGEVSRTSPKGHRGIDIATRQRGTGYDILAIEEGEVVFSGWNVGGYGYTVTLQHPDGKVSLYAHLYEQPPVSIGQYLQKGQILGSMGSTGYSTGPHLHLEVYSPEGYLQDPSIYLDFSKLNYIPVPPTPIPTPEAIQTIVRQNTFVESLYQRYMEFVWTTTVAKNRQRELRDIWIWNTAVYEYQQQKIEDLYIVSFFLVPWVSVPKVEPMSVQASEAPVQNSAEFYPAESNVYIDFLKVVASQYGADFYRLYATMQYCENRSWDPNVDYIDTDGTTTAGIGQFKESTYKSNARAMGLSEAEISDWRNPYNQLRVMAWMFANGSASAWSGYRILFLGEPGPEFCRLP